MYDAEVKTPLWVAERIKRDDLKGVAKRDGLDFQDDPQVPPLDGGNQYKRSGFDKGHLAPAADFRWSQEAMNQSFIFSNAVPQNPTHNQKIWGNLESMV
jgi:DNA/RNA endonuclease G (NUC1)